MKIIIRFSAIFLSLALLAGIAAMPAGASYSLSRNINKSSFKTDYPYVFVHGMAGWGAANPEYEEDPYWGGGYGKSNTDMIKILNSQGVKAYAAQVGPFNSAWDRACELYAQLTGTVTDYGEVHSKEHNHDRYGFSYAGKPLMGKTWNPANKINLVGHSFGGATIRLFTSLMAYGSEKEVAATKETTSPLFRGGHNSVHSCITLSSPHNGTPLMNQFFGNGFSHFLLGSYYNFMGMLTGDKLWMVSLQMSHFGLTPKQSARRTVINPVRIFRYAGSKDNSYYDLTIGGARELNKTIRLSDKTYYYSYSAVATEASSLTGRQKLVSSAATVFGFTSFFLGISAGGTFDGTKMEGNWLLHDGVVPLASALYPLCDEQTATYYTDAVKKGQKIHKGRWYYMDPLMGTDHLDFCGTEDYPTSFEDFYFTMVETANSR